MSFVAASRRAERRTRWLKRLLVASGVGIALGAVGYRALVEKTARERITVQAEVEQGRQALLHDEVAEARLHLAEAYRRGDRSPTTAFMLARALQPSHPKQGQFTPAGGHMWSATFSPDP